MTIEICSMQPFSISEEALQNPWKWRWMTLHYNNSNKHAYESRTRTFMNTGSAPITWTASGEPQTMWLGTFNYFRKSNTRCLSLKNRLCDWRNRYLQSDCWLSLRSENMHCLFIILDSMSFSQNKILLGRLGYQTVHVVHPLTFITVAIFLHWQKFVGVQCETRPCPRLHNSNALYASLKGIHNFYQ